MKTLTSVLLAVALLIPATARAQQTSPGPPPAGPGGFVMVLAGSQTIPTSRTSSEFQLFGRIGTVETLQRRTTGPLI